VCEAVGVNKGNMTKNANKYVVALILGLFFVGCYSKESDIRPNIVVTPQISMAHSLERIADSLAKIEQTLTTKENKVSLPSNTP
jgi:hypothetical protein